MLPPDSGAKIVLKPNLTRNMSALTGNTTDLRILSGIITFLKDKGYSNITIGEGTNSGFYRNRIGVIARLKVDALAFDETTCDQCGVCRDVCPLGRDLPRDPKKHDDRCIKCLYCYSVCPKQAVRFTGAFGFFEEQLNQNDSRIRKLYEKKNQ